MDLNTSQQIKAINKTAVHHICSGQVVLNLAIAVKELIENSLDAGATVIDVRLREHGSELIEVSDNGSGVEPSNFQGLTLKHHTSKLQDFSDLVTVETFGFRGEALSSLCSLSDVTITTRHQSSNCGTRLRYDHNGIIISSTHLARQVGTTVCLENIFSTLPVRHKEFHRNLKREFGKMTQLLYAYCLVSTGVKITCTNHTKKGGKITVIATQGCKTVRENIACVFGSKQLASLLEMKTVLPNEETLEQLNIKNIDINMSEEFQFDGLISSCAHGLGRSTNDRQFYFVNSRPCEPTKVMKAVNEVFHQYNLHQQPFVFLNICSSRDSVDVNVTPDKRQIFLEHEKLLVATIKASLHALYESIPSTYTVNNISTITNNVCSPKQSSQSRNSPASILSQFKHTSALKRTSIEEPAQKHPKQAKLDSIFTKLEQISAIPSRAENGPPFPGNQTVKIPSPKLFANGNDNTDQEDKTFNIYDTGNEITKVNSDLTLINHCESSVICHPEEKLNEDMSNSNVNYSDEVCFQSEITIEKESSSKSSNLSDSNQTAINDSYTSDDAVTSLQLLNEANISSQSSSSVCDLTQNTELMDKNESDPIEIIESKDGKDSVLTCSSLLTSRPNACHLQTDKQSLSSNVQYDTQEFSSRENRRSIEVSVSMDKLRKYFQKSCEFDCSDKVKRVCFRAVIDPSKNKQAEQELSREISKDMFAKMEVIGQFNLGFIIARLGSDLFIVDQHATDEKYNFETLQQTTTISSQKLVVPQQLELTAVNEAVLIDNIDVFKTNGFEFQIDDLAPTTSKVKLSSIPISRNWTFGKEDINELLFMLQDAPGTMCRPSRVRAMFASRACRKSVMIGSALSRNEMRRLLVHMGEIEQPWNCPHGRPTMRHLINLDFL